MDVSLIVFKTLPVWTAATLPTDLQTKHNTPAGTWARLTILAGELTFFELDENGHALSEQMFSPDRQPVMIEPQVWHRIEPASDDLACYLEFLCEQDRYYEKKYQLTAPHSEVVDVFQHIRSGDALDLGCGRGRNSVFLQSRGFRVVALDRSESAITKLKKIIDTEAECREMTARLYDIESATIEQHYDLIVSTVVLQFLSADSIPAVIANMQSQTRPGGINVIVAPISTPDEPCPIDWPFTFAPGELARYYDGWTTLKYNENAGEFHRRDSDGKRLQARFATLVALHKVTAC
ncbi:MAG: SAM-dependent methyltransferase TehB [Pseudomonadota bacterium]